MSIRIERAGIKEIKIVADLFDQYRVWYHQDSDVERAGSFLTERMHKNESVIFIAFYNEQAAGFTQLYPIFSSVRMKPAYLLNDLFVCDTARKKGIADALLNAAYAFAKEKGCAFLMLQTGEENSAAQGLYEKTGWKRSTDLLYELDL